MEQKGVIGTFVGKPITVDYLQKILNDYFDILNDTYAYYLTRDLAEYIIKHFDA